MSSESVPDAPSNDEIINEVVESCKKLNVSEEGQPDQNLEGDQMGSNNNDEDENDEDSIDEVYLKELDSTSTPEDIQIRKKKSIEIKQEGNLFFKKEDFGVARQKYSEALKLCPLEFVEERAILYANRGAAKLKEGLKKEAINDCTKALDLNPNYIKAYIRRAKLYEECDKLDEALEDYKKIVEFDPGCSEAIAATARLASQINERNERLKTEMLSSLKELGNKLLKPFGLSTDNFQLQQDADSGKYSINFSQSRK